MAKLTTAAELKSLMGPQGFFLYVIYHTCLSFERINKKHSSTGTNYRYIATGAFPYYLQCYRGDLSFAQELVNGKWLEYDQQNYKTCGIDDLGEFNR